MHYITHELSLGALILLGKGQSKKDEEPTGLFANPNLDLSKLKGLTGLKYMGK